MATVHVLHAGYNRGDNVGSSVTFVRDGDALIVSDPGLVASRSLILDPLRALGVEPDNVTHVFLTHHHPDHAINVAMFPNAWVIDSWARYKDDFWLDHGGDGFGPGMDWVDGVDVASGQDEVGRALEDRHAPEDGIRTHPSFRRSGPRDGTPQRSVFAGRMLRS